MLSDYAGPTQAEDTPVLFRGEPLSNPFSLFSGLFTTDPKASGLSGDLSTSAVPPSGWISSPSPLMFSSQQGEGKTLGQP